MEINHCVGCARQFFTKSFLGDDAAVLAPSSGEEPHRHACSKRAVKFGFPHRKEHDDLLASAESDPRLAYNYATTEDGGADVDQNGRSRSGRSG